MQAQPRPQKMTVSTLPAPEGLSHWPGHWSWFWWFLTLRQYQGRTQ